jgi:hypothetical protein
MSLYHPLSLSLSVRVAAPMIPPQEVAMLTEKRKEARRRCYLGGRIEFNQRRTVLDCIVRDRTAQGMRVVLQGARALPIEFDLVLPEKREIHRAEIVWRTADVMGLITAPADRRADDNTRPPTDMG